MTFSPLGILLLIFMTTFATPGKAEFIEDVEYGRADNISLRLDAHIPAGSGPFAAAIIVHGGGWVMGDRKHTVEPLFKPIADAGLAWFSISYRLAGSRGVTTAEQGISSILTMGTAVDDVRQAVAFVKAHAAEYRVDPARIALVGESAGAQLASMAALKPGETAPSKPSLRSTRRTIFSRSRIRRDRFPIPFAARSKALPGRQ